MMENRAHLEPQFADIEQQRQAVNAGIWIFLLSEVMLFGGMATAYAVYRFWYPQAFILGTRLMSFKLGSLNTAVLLTSSLTMALASRSAKVRDRKSLRLYLVMTACLGALFLAIKFYEYGLHFQDGLFPGINWHYQGIYARPVEIFFIIYFVMTGAHAVHLTIGTCWVLALTVRNRRFANGHDMPIEVATLYWHLVDVVWIFLYPAFYLIGHAA